MQLHLNVNWSIRQWQTSPAYTEYPILCNEIETLIETSDFVFYMSKDCKYSYWTPFSQIITIYDSIYKYSDYPFMKDAVQRAKVYPFVY